MSSDEIDSTISRLRVRDVVLGLLLTCTSGVAIIVHTFLPVPMSITVPLIVFPSASICVGLVLLRFGRIERFHAFSGVLLRGGTAGLIATLGYDAIRPALTWVFGLSFNPYRAMPLFGELITGRPASDPLTIAAGWTYHFWNGISFGMMFSLIRPRGGPVAGLIWAMTLQALMMIVYPSFLKARLSDIGFLLTGIVGHGLWGIVLGVCLRRWKDPHDA